MKKFDLKKEVKEAIENPGLMFRVVLTCWDYKVHNKPYVDCVSVLYPTRREASDAVSKCVKEELEALNDGRSLIPVTDCDGNIVCYDYDFRADENSDHENCIHFCDGDDYQEVTYYDIFPVQFMRLPDNTYSAYSCEYRGFYVLANEKHNRFQISSVMVRAHSREASFFMESLLNVFPAAFPATGRPDTSKLPRWPAAERWT